MYDFVSVRDRHKAFDEPYFWACGHVCAPTVISETRKVTIEFNADRGVTDTGFRLRYDVVNASDSSVGYPGSTFCNCNSGEGCLGDENAGYRGIGGTCGQRKAIRTSAVIVSPRYPIGYEGDLNCIWTVKYDYI